MCQDSGKRSRALGPSCYTENVAAIYIQVHFKLNHGSKHNEPWPRDYKKKFHTQLIMKFILLINVKMPTVVGILTFISIINTTSERHKARDFICQYFSFYEQLKFSAQLSLAW